jgi:hypothetical protein
VQIAHADIAPERGLISIKNFDYNDSQLGSDRVGVKANNLELLRVLMMQFGLSRF